MKLIAYLRVSTAEQAKEGVSLSAQERKIRGWAEALDHEIVAVMVDAGVSASIPPFDRSGFKEAAVALSQKKADGLVAISSDRLCRSTVDTLDLASRFVKSRWALLSLRESLDTSTAMNRFTLTLRAAVAELELGLAGERTTEAMSQVRQQGRRFSGLLPWGSSWGPEVNVPKFGRDRMTRTLVPNQVELAISEHYLRLCAEGKSYREIAAALNAEGTHPRTRRTWGKNEIGNLYRSIVRSGVLVPNRRNSR